MLTSYYHATKNVYQHLPIEDKSCNDLTIERFKPNKKTNSQLTVCQWLYENSSFISSYLINGVSKIGNELTMFFPEQL